LLEAWFDDMILQDFVLDRFQRIGQLVEAFIVTRVEDGAFRSIDPSLVTRMILGMFMGTILPVLRGVAPPPSAEERQVMAGAVVDLLLDGIRVHNE
jgi:hypothetical protein